MRLRRLRILPAIPWCKAIPTPASPARSFPNPRFGRLSSPEQSPPFPRPRACRVASSRTANFSEPKSFTSFAICAGVNWGLGAGFAATAGASSANARGLPIGKNAPKTNRTKTLWDKVFINKSPAVEKPRQPKRGPNPQFPASIMTNFPPRRHMEWNSVPIADCLTKVVGFFC